MTSEELRTRLDAAVSIPDRKKAKKTIASLLQQAYDENLILMCPAVPDPDHLHLCNQAFLNVGPHRYFILFTKAALFGAFFIPEHPDLKLAGLSCREVLDDMFPREDVQGLALNPYFDGSSALHAGLILRKTDLPFGMQQESVPPSENPG